MISEKRMSCLFYFLVLLCNTGLDAMSYISYNKILMILFILDLTAQKKNKKF